MFGKFQEHLQKELADIQAAGLYKNERIITTPQRADIKVRSSPTSRLPVCTRMNASSPRLSAPTSR